MKVSIKDFFIFCAVALLNFQRLSTSFILPDKSSQILGSRYLILSVPLG